METITTRRAGGANVVVTVGESVLVGVAVGVAVCEAVAVNVGACVAVGGCEGVGRSKDSPGVLGIWQASRRRIENRSKVVRRV